MKKISLFVLGFCLAGGIVLAASVVDISSISEKKQTNNTLTDSDVNTLVNTLRGLSREGDVLHMRKLTAKQLCDESSNCRTTLKPQPCPSGQFIQSIAVSGEVSCSLPPQ